MSKIVYNSSNMKNITVSHIRNSIDLLQKAITSSQEIMEPSSYEEMEYLKSLSTKIGEEANNLKRLNDWIENNNNKYGIIVKTIDDSIRNIDTIVIKKRMGYISRK